MPQTAHPVDLQSAIAAYLRQRAGEALTVEDIARGTGATRAATSTMLCRIVNGEARDYPIERSGRARYAWMRLDDAAKTARLARVIIDLTGVDADRATSVASAAVAQTAAGQVADQSSGGSGWHGPVPAGGTDG